MNSAGRPLAGSTGRLPGSARHTTEGPTDRSSGSDRARGGSAYGRLALYVTSIVVGAIVVNLPGIPGEGHYRFMTFFGAAAKLIPWAKGRG